MQFLQLFGGSKANQAQSAKKLHLRRSFLPQLSQFGYKARLNGLEGKNGWASFLMLALCLPTTFNAMSRHASH